MTEGLNVCSLEVIDCLYKIESMDL